jgi:CcmD family protein
MGYLAAAYIIVWGLVAAYVVFLGVRQRRLEEEIQILEEMVEERSGQ